MGLGGLGQSLQVCDALGDALFLLKNKHTHTHRYETLKCHFVDVCTKQ